MQKFVIFHIIPSFSSFFFKTKECEGERGGGGDGRLFKNETLN
jgi:hypothetical protein